MTMMNLDKLEALTPEQVKRVYISKKGKGGNNKCRCGCNGTYYEHESDVMSGGTKSDAMIRKALYIVKAFADEAEFGNDIADVMVEGKTYTLHLS